MAQVLYPSRNFSFTPQLLANRPQMIDLGISGRIVDTAPAKVELKRQSSFTFAVIDMLQVSAPTKVALLQVTCTILNYHLNIMPDIDLLF